MGSVIRSASGYAQLLKDQYGLLKGSVDDFYAGHEAKANDAAGRIRTMVHNTAKSTALLSLIAPNYMTLAIYHRTKRRIHPRAVFVLQQPVQISSDGKSKFIRDDFT